MYTIHLTKVHINLIVTFSTKIYLNANLSFNILDDATLIMVNLFIRSFAKIDDVKMEYSVQITFRQKWSDDRLAYKHRLTEDMSSKWNWFLECGILGDIHQFDVLVFVQSLVPKGLFL